MTNAVAVAQGGTVNTTFRNRIINGAMMIDQRNAGASVTGTSSVIYNLDRYASLVITDGVMTFQQVADAPSGFKYSLKATTTTADASLSATQRAILLQRIEGYNVADFMLGSASAAQFTLSFWVKSTLTGTFGGAFQNVNSDRAYPFTYTISSASTWEQKTITITGDLTGTWNTTTGTGLQIVWGLGVGSTNSATAGSWQAGDFNSATGGTSVIGTLNATWQVTGVQLEAGTTATPFEQRLYGTEFDLCRRYYARLTVDQNKVVGTGWVINSTNGEVMVPLRPQMRSVPTFGSSTASNFNINYVTCTALALSDSGQATVDTVCVKATTAGSLTASQGSMLRSGTASQYVEFIAEL